MTKELHPSILHINAKNLSESTIKLINKMVEKVNENEREKFETWHPIEFAGTWAIHDEPFYTAKNLLAADDVGYDKAHSNAILAASAPELEYKVNNLTTEVSRLREALELSKEYALNIFIAEIKKEFADQNWDYLDFIKVRVLTQALAPDETRGK